MNNQFTQPKNGVSKETNKEAIARIYGVLKSEVEYLEIGESITGLSILYEKDSQTAWMNDTATGTIISWSVLSNIMTIETSAGFFHLKRGDVITQSDLDLSSAASKIQTTSGNSIQTELTLMSVEYTNTNQNISAVAAGQINNHRYNILMELPSKFTAYDSVVAAGGYSYLYASGHFIDHVDNELWVFFPAAGGDTGSWYVVYDLTTLAEKTYFKAGIRWSKCFSLNRVGSNRYLYSRGANGWLAKFDVTVLPVANSTVDEMTAPRASVKYIYASILGDEMLVPYDAPTTNTTAYSNTYNILDKNTWAFKRSIRMDTIGAGNEYGADSYLYKNQGTVFHPEGVAIAYGGLVDSAATPASDTDLRTVQGVLLKTQEGVTIKSGLFDPHKGMQILRDKGYVVSRFEHEGLFYDTQTSKLTTIWHYNDASIVGSTFLIVEAFSTSKDAMDFAPASLGERPLLPDIITLFRSNFVTNVPTDPISGANMTDISDVCNMMIRYDTRTVIIYSTNFAGLTFNGAALPGSSFCELTRGTNTTFKLSVRNTGVNQEWLIQISGTSFTYTRIKMMANEYMFEATATGSFVGTGSPEGVVTASSGSIYHNRTGGAGVSIYVKESGSGNTGWIAK